MFSAIYLSLLFSQFVFLFSLSFSFSSRHGTHSTISNVYYNQPVILGRYEIFYGPLPNKKVHVSYNQPNALIFSWKKRMSFFLTPYQITFFLVFDQPHALTPHLNEHS